MLSLLPCTVTANGVGGHKPGGGGGDAASRLDTRQDRWRYFEFLQPRWSEFVCHLRVLRPHKGEGPNVESQAIWLLTRQSRLGVYTRRR